MYVHGLPLMLATDRYFNRSKGDVLVMQGPGIQQVYEHTVIPTGIRLAATARYIEPRRVRDRSAAR